MPKLFPVLALVSALAAPHVGAEELAPPPPMEPCCAPPVVPVPAERYELRRNAGLMTAGIVMLSASYMPMAITGYAIERYQLAIPIAGPLAFAAGLDQSKSDDRIATGFLVMDAMVQASGLVLAIVGASTKSSVRLGNRFTITASAGGIAGRF